MGEYSPGHFPLSRRRAAGPPRPVPSRRRAGVGAARGALAALAAVAPRRTNALHPPARDIRDRAAEKSRFSQHRNCPRRHSNEINPQESENQMFHYLGNRRGWKIRLGRSYIKLTWSIPSFNFHFHKGTEIWRGRERVFSGKTNRSGRLRVAAQGRPVPPAPAGSRTVGYSTRYVPGGGSPGGSWV